MIVVVVAAAATIVALAVVQIVAASTLDATIADPTPYSTPNSAPGSSATDPTPYFAPGPDSIHPTPLVFGTDAAADLVWRAPLGGARWIISRAPPAASALSGWRATLRDGFGCTTCARTRRAEKR